MHSVTESATTTREQRRLQTERRISVCAQRLTEEHGLDGFTMEDLADAAEVSRRTLFNYFPSKIDAVLGAVPDIPAADLATFRAGGPHGHLLEDLGALALVLLNVSVVERAELELGQRVVLQTPRLLAAAHARFEVLTGEFVTLVLEREGAGFGADRARLLVRILVAVFDASVHALLSNPVERPLADAFEESLRSARELLA